MGRVARLRQDEVMTRLGDHWARWLLRERFGGRQDLYQQAMSFLTPIRDRVLDGADLERSDVVLDVGCGDGLLGFEALRRLPTSARVIFSDVSQDLLDECRRVAQASEATARCDFVRSCLPGLTEIPDESVNVVVLRSVLIYVPDKQDAFQNFGRVLRPGGRLSLYEPINSFGWPEPPDRLWGLGVDGLEPLAQRVKTTVAGYMPNSSPMLDFDERDLLRWAEQAGFEDLHLTYEAHVGGVHPAEGQTLEAFLSQSPNPNMPTLAQILEESLAVKERHQLKELLAAGLRSGNARATRANAFLTARVGH